MVAEQHFYLGSLFEHDEHTTVDHEVYITTQDVYHLNGTIYLHVLGHIDVEAILCQHRVEIGNGIIGLTCQAVVVLAGGKVLQRTDDNTLRQMSLGFLVVIENIIYHKVQAGREVGHVATERVVRVDRNLEAIQVQAVIGGEELLHVGILVALDFPSGETIRRETLESRVTLGIHHVAAVLADHPATLLIEVDILLFCFHNCQLLIINCQLITLLLFLP